MSISFIEEDEPVVSGVNDNWFNDLLNSDLDDSTRSSITISEELSKLKDYLSRNQLRRGHKIRGIPGQIMNLFDPDESICRRSLFDGFDERRHKIFFYESDTDIEEYGDHKEFFFEKLGLLNFPLEYHTNECSSLRKLADSIKPISVEKAQRFKELINKDCPLEIDVFVSRIWEDDSHSPYCEFLGHYQLYCIESLAHGAFAFRRTSEEGHFTKK